MAQEQDLPPGTAQPVAETSTGLDPVRIDERRGALDGSLGGVDDADIALKHVIEPVIDVEAHLAALLRRGPGIAAGIVQQKFVAADLERYRG